MDDFSVRCFLHCFHCVFLLEDFGFFEAGGSGALSPKCFLESVLGPVVRVWESLVGNGSLAETFDFDVLRNQNRETDVNDRNGDVGDVEATVKGFGVIVDDRVPSEEPSNEEQEGDFKGFEDGGDEILSEGCG